MAGGRSTKAHHHHHHHPHRAEADASSPAPTSVAVVPARSGSGEAPRRRAREQQQPQGQGDARNLQLQQLRRSEAFPPKRSAAYPPRRQLHQRCDSEIAVSHQHRSCGEVAGGTTAGCAAVCCCFPCVMVEVVVLATVRAPAALARKAVRVRRGRRRSASAGEATDIYELLVDQGDAGEAAAAADEEEDILTLKPHLEEQDVELDKEVWARFQGAGFWRSPSQLTDEVAR
ncbi:hypothetical protein ACP4OV_008671 [Aristida adscensionis]